MIALLVKAAGCGTYKLDHAVTNAKFSLEHMSYGELMDDLSSAWYKTDTPEDPTTDDGYWAHTLQMVFDELEALGMY